MPDLGVVANDKNVILFSNSLHDKQNNFRAGISNDGLYFKSSVIQPKILNQESRFENSSILSDFMISKCNNLNYLVYKKHLSDDENVYLASSKDYFHWKIIGKIDDLKHRGMLSPLSGKNKYDLFFGETAIQLATSFDLHDWKTDSKPILEPRPSAFDKFPLQIGGLFAEENGLLVLYFVKIPRREGEQYAAGAALLAKDDAHRVLWRSDTPIWEQPEEWNNSFVYPLSAAKFKGKLLFYFGIAHQGVVAVSFEDYQALFNPKRFFPTPVLGKHPHNPIITPVLKHSWENQSTFNAAAVYEEGKIHLLYRAQGDANTSVLGYANSKDGKKIHERLDMPAYIPREPFETPYRAPFALTKQYMSGGGYGGCEDPRLTKINDRFYLTYVAFNGMDPPRVALSSIGKQDFLQQNWNWDTPKLISPPGVVDKNAVLFPEKIGGKYVMMHRIFPNMLIDFLDDLKFNDYLKGEYRIEPRENTWDSRKVGAGAPPIKTKDGWLLIYHAVDDRDDRQYKIGAMLLDLKDPTKVRYRSLHPILTPTEWYENEGYKAGVTYPCGAVVVNGTLMVYYGGADTVVCVATKNLDDFLKELKESSPITLETLPTHQFVTTNYV